MENKSQFKGCIFDLDGVIVDTAKFHFLAWQKLANLLDITFTEEDNEALKGVSRTESLNHILGMGGLVKSDEEKTLLASMKNAWYIDMISHLDHSALMPGVIELMDDLKVHGIKIALGSASKNALPVLRSTGILEYFHYISDGNSTDKSKPDPEVFYIAAEGLSLQPHECIVFEDSIKGLEAAQKGGFLKVGIGNVINLPIADFVVEDLSYITFENLNQFYKNQ